MTAPDRERPSEAPRPGRFDPRLARAIGASLLGHVLVVIGALLLAAYSPEPFIDLPPGGPMVDVATPLGDSKIMKIGPLAKASGIKGSKPQPANAEPPKPEPPKPEPPKPEPPKPEPPKAEPAKVEPPKPKPDALPEPKKPEPKPEPKKPEPKPEAKKPEPKKPEPKPEAKKPEPKPEPKKPEPEKPAPKPEAKPDPKKPDPKVGAKGDAKTDAKPPAKTDDNTPPVNGQEDAGSSKAGKPSTGGGTEAEGGRTGEANGGGGTGNRSPEFYAYYAYMHRTLKDQFVWPGEQDPTLVATVRFGILADGTIADARITVRSRDPLFDEAALKAVRAAGKLTPPPPTVAADFEDVEFDFRVADSLVQP